MIYIVDIIGDIVASMREVDHLDPYYMYGHRLEINNRLLDKDKDKIFKYQKYPLIALRMDIPEQVENGYWHFNLNIAVLAMIKEKPETLNAEDRMSLIFKPVLYPLYMQFLEKLRASGMFAWPGHQGYPPHTKIDRPFWGTPDNEGNKKNIFSDPLDAIEIVNLKINSRQRFNCS